jgi:hypothetical protein
LIDASGNKLFSGEDQAQLAARLNEWMGAQADRDAEDATIYVEMKGFSEDKAAALATSLSIQQHLIDPLISIRILPHFVENRAPTEYLFTRGIKLERASILVESVKDGSMYHSDLSFTVRTGFRVVIVVLRITCTVQELAQEFIQLVRQYLPSDHFDEGASLSVLVNRAVRELKKRHEGLTEEQLRIDMIGQFGNIRIAQRPPFGTVSWT